MKPRWTISAVHAGLRVVAALGAQQEPSDRRYTAERAAFADIVSQVEAGALDPADATVQFDQLTVLVSPCRPL